MMSKTIAERTKPGQRQTVEEQSAWIIFRLLYANLNSLDYTFHCYNRSEGIAGVIISKDYPDLTAQYILGKVLDEFLASVAVIPANNEVDFPQLRKYLNDYQDPSKAGSIATIKQELDETKVILHKTIESVSFS